MKVVKRLFFGLLLALNAQSAFAYPDRCIAIRGNGELIPAHWSAMGRLIEEEGLFDGGAGGSSASVTLFLYESMLLNPQLRNCEGGTRLCTEEEIRLRASLLMKSLFAYLDVVKNDDDYLALIGLGQALAQDKAQLAKIEQDPKNAQLYVAKYLPILRNVVNRPQLRGLINKDFVQFIEDKSPGQEHRVREAVNGIKSFGNFDSTDKAIFFRPGLLSFPEVAERIGRAGNFYAGRGSYYAGAGMQKFLDRCAPLAKGRTWTELAKQQGANASCHLEAVKLISAYRDGLKKGDRNIASRLDESVGANRFHALISLAVVANRSALNTLRTELEAYYQGQGFDRSRPLSIFDQVKFGYYASELDAPRAFRRDQFIDLKSSKAVYMGSSNWKDVLTRSPAEPGLSAIIRGTAAEGRAIVFTAAGWTDLAPTLVLKNLNCGRIVYLTRMGQDAQFAQGVEKLLGASPDQLAALHALDRPSSFQLSLKTADRVYCTNWNNQQTNVFKLEHDAYHAQELWGEGKYLGCGGMDSEVKK